MEVKFDTATRRKSVLDDCKYLMVMIFF